MAKSTMYLYGIQPNALNTMPYSEALKFKIESAKTLLRTLLEPKYADCDVERINLVSKAIKFNEDLLEELKC